MDAAFEVQLTIKRAELTVFVCLLEKVIGSIKVHVDNKGVIDGLWRGERKCIGPKAGGADNFVSRDIVVEVEHSEKFVTEGNEKTMSWQRREQCWMKDLWRKQRQKQFNKREKRCTQPCSVQPAFAVWWRNGKIVKNSSGSQKWILAD